MSETEQEDTRPLWRRFLFPHLTKMYLLRLVLVAVFAWLFFSYVCIPCRINGSSMEPTYYTGELTFCCALTYRFRPIEAGDIVAIEYLGHEVMFLKRVIALEGDTVAFQDGRLLVNGVEPPYPWAVCENCHWNMEPITVRDGCVFVVGDNRTMPQNQHRHGEVDRGDIVGTVLW